MKRTDFLRHLEKHGCEFVREGKQHTLYITAKPRNPLQCRDIARFQVAPSEASAEEASAEILDKKLVFRILGFYCHLEDHVAFGNASSVTVRDVPGISNGDRGGHELSD
jgi:hypothetical protein